MHISIVCPPSSWAMVGNEGEITLFHCKTPEMQNPCFCEQLKVFIHVVLCMKSAAVMCIMAIFILLANLVLTWGLLGGFAMENCPKGGIIQV